MDPEEVTAGSRFTESEWRKWQDSRSRLCLFWGRHRHTMVNKKRGGEPVAYLEKWQCVWKRPEHWRQWVRSPPAMWQTPHTSLTLVSSPPEHWFLKKKKKRDCLNKQKIQVAIRIKRGVMSSPGFCHQVRLWTVWRWRDMWTGGWRRRRRHLWWS